jgi:hypothetical protein
LHRNIISSEKVLSTDRLTGSAPLAPARLFGEVLEIDTLELTRRGREEQARVIGELFTAGLGRLARLFRQVGGISKPLPKPACTPA